MTGAHGPTTGGASAPTGGPDPGGLPQGTGRSSRWRWLLVASLAMNLLVIGAVAGAYVMHRRQGPPRWAPIPADFGLMHFSGKLPEDRKTVIRELLRQSRGSVKELREKSRAVRMRAVEELASPDYDPQRMRSIMGAIAAADDRLRNNGIDVLLKSIDVMTPEERQKFAESWRKRMRFGEGRQRRKAGDPDAAFGN